MRCLVGIAPRSYRPSKGSKEAVPKRPAAAYSLALTILNSNPRQDCASQLSRGFPFSVIAAHFRPRFLTRLSRSNLNRSYTRWRQRLSRLVDRDTFRASSRRRDSLLFGLLLQPHFRAEVGDNPLDRAYRSVYVVFRLFMVGSKAPTAGIPA
jgi:hypothetical protein